MTIGGRVAQVSLLRPGAVAYVGLKRYQQMRRLHFVTFSCYRRQAHLEAAMAKDLFEGANEAT